MHVFPNGKRYIGKTVKKLSYRTGKDFSGYKTQELLWRAIQKYGVDAIRTEILYRGISESELSRYEMLCIARWGTHHSLGNGYNGTWGGEGFDSETARKNTLKRNRELVEKGEHHFQSDEHRKRVGQLTREQAEAGTHPWQSSEHREIIRELRLKRNRERIEAGTHNWQSEKSRESTRERNRQQAEKGEHPFQSEEFIERHRERIRQSISKRNREQLRNGTHYWQSDKHRQRTRKRNYARKLTNKAKRRELYRLTAIRLFTKSLCEIYKTRQHTREGNPFDKSIPDTSQAEQLDLF